MNLVDEFSSLLVHRMAITAQIGVVHVIVATKTAIDSPAG